MRELLSGRQQGILQGKLRSRRQFLAHSGAKLSRGRQLSTMSPYSKGSSKQGLTGNATLQDITPQSSGSSQELRRR
jgi:hypothetical protein